MKLSKLFPIDNKAMSFPDHAITIRQIRNVKVKRFPNYCKATVFGEKNWTVRLKTTKDAAIFVELLSHGVDSNPHFLNVGDNIYTFPLTFSNFYNYKNFLREIEELPILEEENIKENNDKIEGVNNMNIINAAVTFERELAFIVNGKYVTITTNNSVKEIPEAFIMMKSIPALIPTVADKITAGSYYTSNGNLYKAIADNKVIDLKSGLISEIAISSIPMTDKVIIYKPIFDVGKKISSKELLKAQMLSNIGDNNSLMLMTLLDEDIDMKNILLMQALNGENKEINPLMFALMEDKTDDFTETLLLMQMMNGNNNSNNLLPLLMMMKKDKKAE